MSLPDDFGFMCHRAYGLFILEQFGTNVIVERMLDKYELDLSLSHTHTSIQTCIAKYIALP